MPRIPTYTPLKTPPIGGSVSRAAEAARGEAQGVAQELARQQADLRREVAATTQDIRRRVETEVRSRVDAVKSEIEGTVKAAAGAVLASAVASIGTTATAWAAAALTWVKGIGVLIAAYLTAREITPLVSRAVSELQGVTDHVHSEWLHQLGAWQRLYEAAGNGRRLPLYDRVFRFRRVEGIGFDMRRVGECFLPVETVTALSAIAERLGFTWEYLGPPPETRADGTVVSAYPRAGEKFDPDPVSRVNPLDDDLVRVGLSFLRRGGAIVVDDRGWPVSRNPAPSDAPAYLDGFLLTDRRVAFPEIPAEWVQFVPGVYLLFWIAPPDVSGAALLKAWEEYHYALATRHGDAATGRTGYTTTVVSGWESSSSGLIHASPGDAPHPPGSGIVSTVEVIAQRPGGGMVLTPLSWVAFGTPGVAMVREGDPTPDAAAGVWARPPDLRPLDSVAVITDAAYIAGEWFGIRVGLGGDWLVPEFTTLEELLPESYLAILTDLGQYRGGEWIAIQEAIDLDGDPQTIAAIDLAGAVFEGDAGGISAVDALLTRARAGDADALSDLVLLSTALSGYPGEVMEGV